MQFKETSEEMKQTGDQVTIERLAAALRRLRPASTRIEIDATDGISNQTISKTADFTVKAAARKPTKAAANTVPGR